MDQSKKSRKGIEGQTLAVCVEARAEAYGSKHPEEGVIWTGKKVYMPQLPSKNKEVELSEDLNYGMEWVLRYYGGSLKQEKDHLPPRDDVAEFDVRTNEK